MKYLIRIFTKDDENVKARYYFETLPFMPRIGEILTIKNTPYRVLDIVFSFDNTLNEEGIEFMIDYTVEETEW